MIRRGEYIGFCGALGSGKTLSMTRLAAMEALDGRQVYANYPTVFATTIESIPHLFSIRDAVICLDELQSTMDSREFKKAGDIAQWVLIVRKLGNTVLYTTQAFGMVDIRVRQITTYLYQCQPARWGGSDATLVELYKLVNEEGRKLKKFFVKHSPELYALYDSFDYQVKLTEGGRVASFGGDRVAASVPEAEPGTLAAKADRLSALRSVRSSVSGSN